MHSLVGALTQDGTLELDERLMKRLGLTYDNLKPTIEKEKNVHTLSCLSFSTVPLRGFVFDLLFTFMDHYYYICRRR